MREALANSTLTVLDDRIKANIKTGGRITLILREIPSDVPVAEIRDIFAYEGCKPIASIRPDIEDTWFVNMESEEDAKATLLDLTFKKRTFRGSSVKARLKSDTVVRSFYTPPPPPQHFAPMPYNPAGTPSSSVINARSRLDSEERYFFVFFLAAAYPHLLAHT